MKSATSCPRSRSWSISDDSLRRYVYCASENCIQELLSASDPTTNTNNNKLFRDTNRDIGSFGRLDSSEEEEEGEGDGHDKDNNSSSSSSANYDQCHHQQQQDHHADQQQGWKVLGIYGNGAEVSKRSRRPSGSPRIFRSRWILPSVSPKQFVSVANAIDAAKQWDSDLVEARHIKDIADNLSIVRIRFGENAKPLFRNREFVVYERRETMDDGTLVVAVASLPKEISEGLYPKQSNAIRGLLLQSGWVVEKFQQDSCIVTYVVQLDPAGWLPKCFVNRFNTKLVMIIEKLKKKAQATSIHY